MPDPVSGCGLKIEGTVRLMPAFNRRVAPWLAEKSNPNRSRTRLSSGASLGPLTLGRERPRQTLGRPPLVAVVKAANLRYGNHASVLWRVHKPRFGRVLSQ